MKPEMLLLRAGWGLTSEELAVNLRGGVAAVGGQGVMWLQLEHAHFGSVNAAPLTRGPEVTDGEKAAQVGSIGGRTGAG